jgi:predicted DNA-binding ribbon-helix-helix protein
MCQVFISADPHLYDCRVRSVRLHGVATSIRLENLFWNVLDDIAVRDGMTVPQLCTKLYDELVAERGEVDNFASFLRVCCGRYLALQLSGGIRGRQHSHQQPQRPARVVPSAARSHRPVLRFAVGGLCHAPHSESIERRIRTPVGVSTVAH